MVLSSAKQAEADPSSPALPPFPSLSALSTYVHRPQAIAKCFISDVYRMKALVSPGEDAVRFGGRGECLDASNVCVLTDVDVFLLNCFPCKMVELVGWIAGVDHKEASMTVTLDDGDGQHVLPVTLRLTLVNQSTQQGRSHANTWTQATRHTQTTREPPSTYFLSARERKAKRKAMVEEEQAALEVKRQIPTKTFVRKDVSVGDTVRVVGRLDEYARKKAGGEVEWVRGLYVEQGSGGSIAVVGPEEQQYHAAVVMRLHDTLYSRPFQLPAAAPPSIPSSPIKSLLSTFMDTLEPSSEMPNESNIGDMDIQLRPPSQLRSSQLTDRTFRQYVMDHITQATVRSVRMADAAGPLALSSALEPLFPEYVSVFGRKSKGKERARSDRGVLRTLSRENSQEDSLDNTPRAPRTREASSPDHLLLPWTLTSILAVPHLAELAQLVVDNVAREEERRRRRRIADGAARTKDLEVEQERVRRGKGKSEWRLTEKERRRKMKSLAEWAIRGMAEDGELVQVECNRRVLEGDISAGSPSPTLTEGSERYGYIPIPPALLLPLLLSHLRAERATRSKMFFPKGDPRWNNGMTLDELLCKLRGWGEDGRWERTGRWKVEEAVEWGEAGGWLQRCGSGWWASDGG